MQMWNVLSCCCILTLAALNVLLDFVSLRGNVLLTFRVVQHKKHLNKWKKDTIPCLTVLMKIHSLCVKKGENAVQTLLYSICLLQWNSYMQLFKWCLCVLYYCHIGLSLAALLCKPAAFLCPLLHPLNNLIVNRQKKFLLYPFPQAQRTFKYHTPLCDKNETFTWFSANSSDTICKTEGLVHPEPC